MRAPLVMSMLLCACGARPEVEPRDAGPAPREVAPAEVDIAPSTPRDPSRVGIPAGEVIAGSPPGTAGRRPSREADEAHIALPAFEIDRLPVSGELGRPRLVHDRATAERLCNERGGRLCGELEWERACEASPSSAAEAHAFPGGEPYDLDRCGASEEACASGFGVLRMGLDAPEWTAGEVPPDSVRMERSAVLRGARADAPVEQHRCDARSFETPTGTPAAVRCCYGQPAPPAYPPIAMHRQTRDLEIDLEGVRAALRSVPELASIADHFEVYGATEGGRAVARGNGTLAGWEIAPGPFSWSPSPGEEAWVLTGATESTTWIVVLYPREGGRFSRAASFEIEGREPVVIARTPPSRAELQWSTCVGCAGESGVIRFDDDAVIRIIQR